MPILQTHVAMKGFLRTLVFLLVVAGWVGWLMLAFTGRIDYLALAGLAWPASYIAFLAYLKLERRFTLETLMAFAVTYGDERSPDA